MSSIYGGGDDDVFAGTGNDDVIFGNQGNDSIQGGAGDDILIGDDMRSVVFNATGTDGVAAASNINDFPTNALSYEINFATTDTGEQVFASYAVASQSNEFLLYSNSAGNLQVFVGGSAYTSSLDMDTLADGAIHTLGITWDSTTGELNIYVDGNTVDSTTFRTGYAIQQGGTFVLGQEQDSVGGNYSSSQIFNLKSTASVFTTMSERRWKSLTALGPPKQPTSATPI